MKYEETFIQTRDLLRNLSKKNNGIKIQCFVNFNVIDQSKEAVTLVIIKDKSSDFLDVSDELWTLVNRFNINSCLEELYIEYTDDGMEVFADKELPDYGIKMIYGYDKPSVAIQEMINPDLKENYEYVSFVNIDEGGYSLNIFFKGFLNGEPVKEEYLFFVIPATFMILRLFNRLIRTFPHGTITKITARISHPLKTEIMDASMLIDKMKKSYRKLFEENETEKIVYNVSFKKMPMHQVSKGSRSFDCDAESFFCDGEEERVRFISSTEFEFLYIAIDKSITMLKVEITKENIEFYADKALPQYGIKEISQD